MLRKYLLNSNDTIYAVRCTMQLVIRFIPHHSSLWVSIVLILRMIFSNRRACLIPFWSAYDLTFFRCWKKLISQSEKSNWVVLNYQMRRRKSSFHNLKIGKGLVSSLKNNNQRKSFALGLYWLMKNVIYAYGSYIKYLIRCPPGNRRSFLPSSLIAVHEAHSPNTSRGPKGFLPNVISY